MPADRAAMASTAAGPLAGDENEVMAACTAASGTAPTRNTKVTGCEGRTVSTPPIESSPVKAYSPGAAPGFANRSAAPPVPIVTAIRRSSGWPSEAASKRVRRIWPTCGGTARSVNCPTRRSNPGTGTPPSCRFTSRPRGTGRNAGTPPRPFHVVRPVSTSSCTVAPSGTFATEIGSSVRNSRPTGARSRATALASVVTTWVSPNSVS